MRSIALTPFLFLALLSLQTSHGGSLLDSCRVIILSDSLGEALSAADCERYGLFTMIKGFNRAVVVALPDSSCAVLFSFGDGSSARDSLVRFSWSAVFAMAEKVQHFRELKAGEYVMGSRPVHLRYESQRLPGQREFVLTRSANASPPVLSWEANDRWEPDSLELMWPAHIVARAEDSLPLARAPGLDLPPRYPMLALGIGFRTNALNLSGLKNGPIGSPTLSLSPLVNIVPELLVSREIGVQFDWAYTTGECLTAGAVLVLYAHPFQAPGLRPYVGIGATWTYIHTGLPATGDPAVYFKAVTGGVRGGAGMEIGDGKWLSIVLDVSYDLMAEKTATFQDYGWQGESQLSVPVSINLSSVRFGFRVKFQ